MADLTDELRRRGKKPRQGSRGKRRYRPVVDRGCSKKKAHKTQAEAQVVVDQIKARSLHPGPGRSLNLSVRPLRDTGT